MIQNKIPNYYKRKKLISDETQTKYSGKIFYYKYPKNHEGVFQSYYEKE